MHVMRKYNAKPQRICIFFFLYFSKCYSPVAYAAANSLSCAMFADMSKKWYILMKKMCIFALYLLSRCPVEQLSRSIKISLKFNPETNLYTNKISPISIKIWSGFVLIQYFFFITYYVFQGKVKIKREDGIRQPVEGDTTTIWSIPASDDLRVFVLRTKREKKIYTAVNWPTTRTTRRWTAIRQHETCDARALYHILLTGIASRRHIYAPHICTSYIHGQRCCDAIPRKCANVEQ